MATKKQHKRTKVRRTRRILKNTDVVNVPNSIHNVGYGSGINRRAFPKIS